MKPLPILALAAVGLAGCGEVEMTRVSSTTAASGRIAFKGPPTADLSSGSIYTVRADGKDRRRVTDAGPGVVDSRPDWSPDGSLLVFERTGVPFAVYTVRPD